MTPEEELVCFLERDQLNADTSRPVPQVQLTSRLRTALWALRLFALVIAFMVIYAFIYQVS